MVTGLPSVFQICRTLPRLAILAAQAAAFGSACALASAAEAEPPPFEPVTVIPRAMPTITDPQLAPAAKMQDMSPSELVLGVVVNGQARAYPINMLTGPSREIINDTLGGRAIAATW